MIQRCDSVYGPFSVVTNLLTSSMMALCSSTSTRLGVVSAITSASYHQPEQRADGLQRHCSSHRSSMYHIVYSCSLQLSLNPKCFTVSRCKVAVSGQSCTALRDGSVDLCIRSWWLAAVRFKKLRKGLFLSAFANSHPIPIPSHPIPIRPSVQPASSRKIIVEHCGRMKRKSWPMGFAPLRTGVERMQKGHKSL